MGDQCGRSFDPRGRCANGLLAPCADALARSGCQTVIFTGILINGFVFVELQALSADRELDAWRKLALEFNPKTRQSNNGRRESVPMESKRAT